MQIIKKQSGWTMWSMLFTLSVLGFFAYIAMQLVPVYSANSNMKNAMKISLRDVDVNTVTRSQITRAMMQQLYLDGNIDDLNLKNDLKITRDRVNLSMVVDYKNIVPLFANISLLVEFKPTLKCSLSSGVCTESAAQ